jgi:Fur family peroxide stress response transcriptional regulator
MLSRSSNCKDDLQANQDGLPNCKPGHSLYYPSYFKKDVGLLQEMDMLQGKSRFDPDMQPHAHLVCLQCGSIVDWGHPLVSKVIAEVAGDAKFSVTGQILEITGLCSRCKGKTNLEEKQL